MDSSQPLEINQAVIKQRGQLPDCCQTACCPDRGELSRQPANSAWGINLPSLGNPARSSVLAPTQCHRPDYH